jgi:hypothetical protein
MHIVPPWRKNGRTRRSASTPSISDVSTLPSGDARIRSQRTPCSSARATPCGRWRRLQGPPRRESATRPSSHPRVFPSGRARRGAASRPSGRVATSPLTIGAAGPSMTTGATVRKTGADGEIRADVAEAVTRAAPALRDA